VHVKPSGNKTYWVGVVVVALVVLKLTVETDAVVLEVPVVVKVSVTGVLEVRVDDSVDVVRPAQVSSHFSYGSCSSLS
jgi:hypothetical protein